MIFDLKQALDLILADDKRGNNPIPDPIRFSYFSTNREELIKELSIKLRDQTYRANPLLTIDVPKENFTIRPMARPEIQDWVMYEALVIFLISKISKNISKRSFSASKFKDKTTGTQAWKNFDLKSRDLYEKGFHFVVNTDISGYFENIDLNELRNKLINHIGPSDSESRVIIDSLLTNFLYPWSSGRRYNFGLPQGPNASTFLGEIYLDNVDGEMEEEKGYIRYVDDIRIFCKTEIEAKKALIKIIKSLRKYKLNINAKKTRILKNSEIDLKLFDSKAQILDSIEAALMSKKLSNIYTVIPLLNDLFYKSFSEDDIFAKRHIAFSIFRLSILKNSDIDIVFKPIIKQLLLQFENKPSHARVFCSFLAMFKNDDGIMKYLIDFLFSKRNIYEWQEIHILRALLEMNFKISKDIKKKFFKYLKDKNKHWAVRSLYGLLIGKFGTNTDRELLIDELTNSDVDEFKKNIILAVQELGAASRSDFYQQMNGKIWPQYFFSYVKTLRNTMYLRPYDKPTINTIDDLDQYIDPY